MSWWDSSGFSSFASQAIKSAQKKIDKVLDIPAEERGAEGETSVGSTSSDISADPTTTTPTSAHSTVEQDSFFNDWIPDTALLTKSEPPKSSTRSSFSKSSLRTSSVGTRKSLLKSKVNSSETILKSPTTQGAESALFGGSAVEAELVVPEDSKSEETKTSESLLVQDASNVKVTPLGTRKGISLRRGLRLGKEENTASDKQKTGESTTKPKLSGDAGDKNTEKRGPHSQTSKDKNTKTDRREIEQERESIDEKESCDEKGRKENETNTGISEEEKDIKTTGRELGDGQQKSVEQSSEYNEDKQGSREVCDTSAEPKGDGGGRRETPNAELSQENEESLITADKRDDTDNASDAEQAIIQIISTSNDSERDQDSKEDKNEFGEIAAGGWADEDAELMIDSVEELSLDTKTEQGTLIEDDIKPVPDEVQDSSSHRLDTAQEDHGVDCDIPKQESVEDIKVEDKKTDQEGWAVDEVDIDIPNEDEVVSLNDDKQETEEETVHQGIVPTGETEKIESQNSVSCEDSVQPSEQEANEGNEESLANLELSQTETKESHDDVDKCNPQGAHELEVEERVVPDMDMPQIHSTGHVEDEADLPIDGSTDILQKSSESAATADELSESNRTLTAEDFQDPSAGKITDAKSDNVTEKEVDTREESASGTSASGSPQRNVEDMVSSASSSTVKNMLEEAMVESMKDTDSHSSSSTKSSEMVRIESGHNSGHTSGDEIDTTTSSDIEIISTPTPNGEYRLDRPFDLSPLRHALRGTMRRGSPPGHKRSDSSSSGQSTWSKNGDDLLSPDNGSHPHDTEEVISEQNLTSPSQTQAQGAERGEPSDNPLETDKLLKKLAEMAEILEAREKKLVELSHQSIDLQESNAILKNQLQQSEEARESEMEDLNALTEEFSMRMGESENKIHSISKERDTLRVQLQEAQAMMAKRSDSSHATEMMLKEKDQQISELLEEGEKLSKQQLQSNNIIKKLRMKEKDNETVARTLKQKMEKNDTELAHLRKVCEAKDDLEKRHIEAINQLNKEVKLQQTEVLQYKSDMEDMQEKNRSMQVILDNSYKEIADLHKKNVANASEVQQVALSAEMQAKQELQMAMERQQLQVRQEQEALINQIEDLRLSLSRLEKEQGRREDVLRQEITDLQQRLQEAEERNQELTQSVTAATRPLLRQIENLQSTHSYQSLSYEKVEKNLTERLGEAQTQLAAAVEKERSASEKHMEISIKLSSLESQVSTLRQEKSTLTAHLEMERAKLQVLEDAKNNGAAQLETLRASFEKNIRELKKEKVMLENQLEMEKMRTEAEKKKLSMAHDQVREKELQLQLASTTVPIRSSPSPSLTMDRSFSMDRSMDQSMTDSTISQEDIFEKTLMMASSNGNKTSLYETLRQTGAATLMENLQSQLKMKEGEITQLQSDISELERTRESMARELVNVTTQNEDLQHELEGLPTLKQQYQELDQRYNAILQMYGEKEEEVQELRLDLQDVKDMYKAQIDELLKSH